MRWHKVVKKTKDLLFLNVPLILADFLGSREPIFTKNEPLYSYEVPYVRKFLILKPIIISRIIRGSQIRRYSFF